LCAGGHFAQQQLSENKSLTRKKGKRGTKDDGNGISFHVTESSQRQEEKQLGKRATLTRIIQLA